WHPMTKQVIRSTQKLMQLWLVALVQIAFRTPSRTKRTPKAQITEAQPILRSPDRRAQNSLQRALLGPIRRMTQDWDLTNLKGTLQGILSELCRPHQTMVPATAAERQRQTTTSRSGLIPISRRLIALRMHRIFWSRALAKQRQARLSPTSKT